MATDDIFEPGDTAHFVRKWRVGEVDPDTMTDGQRRTVEMTTGVSVWRPSKSGIRVETQPAHNPELTPLIPDFPTVYPEAYRRLSGRPDRLRPRQLDVAEELRISESTLKRYLKGTRMKWPPVLGRAEKREPF